MPPKLFWPFFLSATIVAVSGTPNRPDLKGYKSEKEREETIKQAAAEAQAKKAAIDKVISMLDQLQAQVLMEGEKEATTYNKFACFCKDTQASKLSAIQKETDEQDSLTASIVLLKSKRKGLDTTLDNYARAIAQAEQDMKDATKDRKATLAEYETNEADLSEALEALKGAMKVLKASKPSLLQLRSVQTSLRIAATLAEVLRFKVDEASRESWNAFLQQDPAVEMENYKFHSSGIIATLEKLLADFTAEKKQVDAKEVQSIADFDKLIQDKTDFVKETKNSLEQAKKSRGQTISEIESANSERSTVSAQLLDDKKYLNELVKMCKDKAITWDQRSRVRQDEVSALTSALAIIKGTVDESVSASTIRFAQQGTSVRLVQRLIRDSGAMSELEAEAEQEDSAYPSMSFLQRKLLRRDLPTRGDGRDAVVALLKNRGKELKSTLLASLANELLADPFAKVKQLIQELIQRLLSEAANEANQKGWCDKSTSESTQRRDYAAQAILELNGQMAGLEADRDKLKEELKVLEAETEGLIRQRQDMTKLRKEEKTENLATVKEAQAGLSAVKQAMDILDKWYKIAAKEEVDLGFTQKHDAPVDDAPDAGFKIGEAYTGAQGGNKGILGMLDVIRSDFERTISETEKAEAEQERQFQEAMTESGMSLASKQATQKVKTKQKDATLANLEDANTNLDAQTEILQNTIQELIKLQAVCIDTGMTYADRVARREDEIAALNKALCILKAYAEYGPDGAKEC